MPLQMSLTLDTEITLAAAYIVVIYINENYNASEVIVGAGIYKNVTAYNNAAPEVLVVEHICEGDDFTTYFAESVLDDAGKTLLTQAEAWLMTLSSYTGATIV